MHGVKVSTRGVKNSMRGVKISKRGVKVSMRGVKISKRGVKVWGKFKGSARCKFTFTPPLFSEGHAQNAASYMHVIFAHR